MANVSIPNGDRDLLLKTLESIIADKTRREKPPAPQGMIPGSFLPTAEDREQGVDLQLVDEARRQKIRAGIENQEPFVRFLAEALPATLGTIVGGIFGGPGGAVAGGLGGEAIGQETGLTPRSNLGLALSAGGPVAGKVIGETVRGGRRLFGAASGGMIPAKVALARNAINTASNELESLGTKIISKQKGLMRAQASTLYKIVENAGVRIPNFMMSNTVKSFKPLRKELQQFSSLPEVKQALGLLNSIQTMFGKGSISFAELDVIKATIGAASRLINDVAPKTAGSIKQVYTAIYDDVDAMVKLGGRPVKQKFRERLVRSVEQKAATPLGVPYEPIVQEKLRRVGNVAKLAKNAAARFKLDGAVKNLEEGIAQYQTFIPGKNDMIVNLKGLRKWLKDATNPKSKKYNKNMTEALSDELPGINKRLRELTEFSDVSPGGPGSLIVRGVFAGVGYKLGSIAGPIGGAGGALLAARAPEGLTAILSSGPAVAFLKKAVNFGKTPIHNKIWMTALQIAAQGVKVNQSGSSGLSANTP